MGGKLCEAFIFSEHQGTEIPQREIPHLYLPSYVCVPLFLKVQLAVERQ